MNSIRYRGGMSKGVHFEVYGAKSSHPRKQRSLKRSRKINARRDLTRGRDLLSSEGNIEYYTFAPIIDKSIEKPMKKISWIKKLQNRFKKIWDEII